MKQVTIKLKKDDLIEWYLEGKDQADTRTSIAEKALKEGYAPIDEQITTAEDIWNWFGYLPARVIDNWDELPLSDEAREIEELEDFDIFGDDVLIQWV